MIQATELRRILRGQTSLRTLLVAAPAASLAGMLPPTSRPNRLGR